MTRYLVTGGAGFIGSHIAETLLLRGERVRVLDNLSTGQRQNLEYLRSLKKGELEFVEGDLSRSDVAKRAVEGISVIFHEAALGSVPKSVEDPISTHQANVTGTVELLWAARQAGVEIVVNAASSSAYGETPELPKRETMVPSPLSPYAVSKLAQEEYCHAFSASYGMRTVSLRYFNVYGPRQDPNSQYAAVIPRFADACLKGERPVIYGDGEQTRDFTFVGDVVAANLQASELKNAKGEVMNIAGGKAISIMDLAKLVAKILDVSATPELKPARPGDIKHSLADISVAKKLIGFEPKVSFEEGLKITLDWYRSNLKIH
jgi:nucleoside-diphosphate-sugar epimerase